MGIPYVGEAGIEGKLTATVGAIGTMTTAMTSSIWTSWKTTWPQGPECVFDLTGELTAQLFFFLDTPLKSVTIPILPEITLFDYTVGCPPLPPPELAHLSDPIGNPENDYFGNPIQPGTLILNIGPLARPSAAGAQHRWRRTRPCLSVRTGRHHRDGLGQVKSTATTMHPIHPVYGDAGLGKNTILVDASVVGPRRCWVAPATINARRFGANRIVAAAATTC